MADARRWIVIGHLVLQWRLTMEWALMVLEWRSTAEEQFGATGASEATRVAIRIGLAQHDASNQVEVDVTTYRSNQCGRKHKSGNSFWACSTR